MKERQYIILSEKQYFGGKAGAGTPQKLINEFPIHTTYVAGFLGLDAVMRYKRPAQFNIGIELNPKVVAVWKNAEYTTNDILPANLTVLQHSFFDINLPCFYDKSTLLYLDPPYTMAERKSNNLYECDLTQAEHELLLSKITQYTCMVAISCYDNDLYRKVLGKEHGWRKISFEVVTRGGTMATETLYMNYDPVPSKELHDVRYLGDDYRSREVLKKRLKTLHRKIEKLSSGERRLLIDELLEKETLSIEHHQK